MYRYHLEICKPFSLISKKYWIKEIIIGIIDKINRIKILCPDKELLNSEKITNIIPEKNIKTRCFLCELFSLDEKSKNEFSLNNDDLLNKVFNKDIIMSKLTNILRNSNWGLLYVFIQYLIQ